MGIWPHKLVHSYYYMEHWYRGDFVAFPFVESHTGDGE